MKMKMRRKSLEAAIEERKTKRKNNSYPVKLQTAMKRRRQWKKADLETKKKAPKTGMKAERRKMEGEEEPRETTAIEKEEAKPKILTAEESVLVDLFRKKGKELREEEWETKKKAEKMKRELKKAAIENEEAKTKIRLAEDGLITITEMLKENYVRLASEPNDHTVWKERSSLVCAYFSEYENKLDLVVDFAEKHSVLDDFFWTSRFTTIGKIGSEVANKELECLKKFLSMGTNNYQAWSYREWIIKKFNKCLWKSELQFCHEILKEHKFAVSVWIQMCRAARQLNHKMGEKSRLEEARYAKEAIISHPGNEGPWTYLKVLYVKHKKTLYTEAELECIFVDVLAEAADGVKLARELDTDYNATYASVANRGCVHALNLVVDLMVYGYEMNKNRRLFNAVNVLCAYPGRLYSVVPPSGIEHLGLLSKVCTAVFSVEAGRVRYCHKYRGHNMFMDLSLFFEIGEKLGKAKHDTISAISDEKEAKNDTLRDDGDDLSPQTEERFGHLLRDNNFQGHPIWKNCLSQTYSDKQRRPETLEEDLKWDIRRCLVKDVGTKDRAEEELRETKAIIVNDAYNRHAWLHIQWVFQTFGYLEDDKEFSFCDHILQKDACNSFAWDHRYFVVTRVVPKLDATVKRGMPELDVAFEDMIERYEKVLKEEVEISTKFISADPGNPFPWAHIFGVHTAFPAGIPLKGNDQVIKAIQKVLENNGSILDGPDLMVNSRGIMNAINMLLDLVVKFHFKIRKNEELRNTMNKLCPDRCFENEWEHGNFNKLLVALQHMEKVFPGVDPSWENVTDQLFYKV